MVKNSILLIALSILLQSCANYQLQVVYLDRDTEVINGTTRARCERSYSSWDGDDWIDYYPVPCDVFLKRKGEPVKALLPPKGSKH